MKILPFGLACCSVASAAPFQEFVPGEIWPDDAGVPINAHGGGILRHEETCYWFGEHKISGEAGNEAHVGVGVYSSEENATLQISLLTPDYLKPAGQYVRIFPGGSNEAPAVLKRNGKYFLITSGCTGCNPNPARLAVANSIIGPWTTLPNPVRGFRQRPEKTGPQRICGQTERISHSFRRICWAGPRAA